MATELQQRLASLCGLDVTGLSKRAAAAVLRVAFAEDVLGVIPARPTTENQKEIANQLCLNDLSPYMEVAALQIESAFAQLNDNAQERHKFEPGMQVRFVGGPNVYGLSYEVGSTYTVSTVKADGRVYFKSTSGAAAYVSQLEPVT